MKKNWRTARVIAGEKKGRQIGYPTINLATSEKIDFAEGIYAALVKFNNTIYKGAMFYGPRLVMGERFNVLEIHILNFNDDIYNQTVSFTPVFFIRKVAKYNSLAELKKAIKNDIEKVEEFFSASFE